MSKTTGKPNPQPATSGMNCQGFGINVQTKLLGFTGGDFKKFPEKTRMLQAVKFLKYLCKPRSLYRLTFVVSNYLNVLL